MRIVRHRTALAAWALLLPAAAAPRLAAQPVIAVSDTSVWLVVLSGAQLPPRAVTITNAGNGSLGDLAATISYPSGQRTGWLSTSLSRTSAPTTLTLTTAAAGLPFARYSASVTVTGRRATPHTVPIGLAVIRDPQTYVGRYAFTTPLRVSCSGLAAFAAGWLTFDSFRVHFASIDSAVVSFQGSWVNTQVGTGPTPVYVPRAAYTTGMVGNPSTSNWWDVVEQSFSVAGALNLVNLPLSGGTLSANGPITLSGRFVANDRLTGRIDARISYRAVVYGVVSTGTCTPASADITAVRTAG